YRFDDAMLLQQALTHRSASRNNNERLEFLGDAVLDFVISEAVFRSHPLADEGDLSKLRSSLVKDESLASLAADLGVGEHLILGGGEMKSGGHRRKSILADALEAIFGAVFVDTGFDASRAIIERVFEQRLQSLPDVSELRDAKTRLQEWLQKRKFELPVYELVDVSGEDHDQQFTVTCTVSQKSAVTEGQASSRRKAEQRAAKAMLKQIRGKSK
ncbi:MAG: ribonuclease III, partial [Pseudomonadota bacterium]